MGLPGLILDGVRTLLGAGTFIVIAASRRLLDLAADGHRTPAALGRAGSRCEPPPIATRALALAVQALARVVPPRTLARAQTLAGPPVFGLLLLGAVNAAHWRLKWRGGAAGGPARVRLDTGRAGAYLPRMAKDDKDKNYKVIAENRRARYDFAIEDDLECGIMLEGSEVKSLRAGGAMIAECYAEVKDGELWLVNGYIAPYVQARTFGHEERRRRKLLVSKRELARLWNSSAREGYTIVPLVMYFNHRGMVKLKVGIGKGKKNHDKRETEAKRDWQRQKSRLMKDHG